MMFEKNIALSHEQAAQLWNGKHTYISIGTHDDGTPAFAKIEVSNWLSMLKEACEVLEQAGDVTVSPAQPIGADHD